MAALTEARRGPDFILWEAGGTYSREEGVLVTGQDLAAGTIVQDNGSGKLTVATGTLNTAGDVSTAVAGILLYSYDATDADVAVAYLARHAEVNQKLLTYPTESTAGGEQAATNASLATLGIIVRD